MPTTTQVGRIGALAATTASPEQRFVGTFKSPHSVNDQGGRYSVNIKPENAGLRVSVLSPNGSVSKSDFFGGLARTSESGGLVMEKTFDAPPADTLHERLKDRVLGEDDVRVHLRIELRPDDRTLSYERELRDSNGRLASGSHHRGDFMRA